jgi:ATP-binding cassette subfamily B protein
MNLTNLRSQSSTFITSISRALRLIWQASSRWSTINAILLVVQGFLPLFLLYVTKLVVDEIAEALQLTEATDNVFNGVLGYIALLIGITLLGSVLRIIETLVKQIQVETVTDHLFKIIHKKSVTLDLQYYENPQYYDTLHRAQQEAQSRPIHITTSLMQIIQNGVSLVAMLGLMFIFHWIIPVALFIAGIPGLLMRFSYGDKLHKWDRENTPAVRHTLYFNQVLTSEIYAKELRLFGLGAYFIERFRVIRERLRTERIQLARHNANIELITIIGSIFTAFLVYVFVANRALQGFISIGDFIMLYQAFQRGQNYLRIIFNGFAALYEDSLFLSNIYEFLDLEPTIDKPQVTKPVSKPMVAGVRFQNVSFQYPGTERKALNNINLSISPQEVIAVVGENGSGKTTLVKLLCRLYDPTEGCITFDGTDYHEIDPNELRREISVVFQDHAHYQLSARENIWFGNIDLPLDDPRIINAAEMSGASVPIHKLSNGYDTILGKWFDDGEELSIGEWQKVALARAFLRDSQILILDEPSSAMDAKAELHMFNQFRELAKGKATVLISHRMSTVKMADRIYVMNTGQIVEAGTHEELMKLNGLYATLYTVQASTYQ